jgi:excisionase family DNA binding protein
MAAISVAEAAQRLGVGVARIHQRIADGSLPASRIGAQWVIDERSLAAVRDSDVPGRPLSERSAWALGAVSRGDRDTLAAFRGYEVTRARMRLQHLLASRSDAEERALRLLRAWLRRRAARQLNRASPRDLPDLRRDSRLLLSGVSDRRSGIAGADVVEGYVPAEEVERVSADYLLSRVAVDADANVVLHVLPGRPPADVRQVAPLWLAADLAEHRSPREEARAIELLTEIGTNLPGTDTSAASNSRNRPRS